MTWLQSSVSAHIVQVLPKHRTGWLWQDRQHEPLPMAT